MGRPSKYPREPRERAVRIAFRTIRSTASSPRPASVDAVLRRAVASASSVPSSATRTASTAPRTARKRPIADTAGPMSATTPTISTASQNRDGSSWDTACARS